MKHLLSIFLSAFILTSAMNAKADTVIYTTPSNQTTVQELPGNARIVTDSSRTVRLNGEESILYRSLFGRYPENRAYRENSAPMADINRFCGQTDNISDRNRCIGDVIRERRDLLKKYND